MLHLGAAKILRRQYNFLILGGIYLIISLQYTKLLKYTKKLKYKSIIPWPKD